MASSSLRRGSAMVAALLFASVLGLSAETFSYSGDTMTTIIAAGSERAILKGKARIETPDKRITADEIELFGEDFIYAVCRGNVRIIDAVRGLDLTSQDLFYDRQQKITRITGNAVMTDLKNEMVVKGGFIEDRDEEQLTIVQIGVRILKKDLVCRAEFAKYYRDKKILELSGMPYVTRRGDEYQAARITINLDTEEITLEGEVKGTIQSEEKEKKEETTGSGG